MNQVLAPGTESEVQAAYTEIQSEQERKQEYNRLALLIGAGWLFFGLGMDLPALPLRYLLKDELQFTPEKMAIFFAIGNFASYVKPFLGILCDAIPLFGTRRRHYLLFSLTAGGVLWLLLSLVPRSYGILLGTYAVMYLLANLTSTSLGGFMVEVGQRFHATGRLSAQRIGISRSVGIVVGPMSGWLATLPFIVATSCGAAMYFLLSFLFFRWLREPGEARCDRAALAKAGLQFKTLFRSRTLWAAAGLVCLVVIAPGFGTPLFYYQTNTLKFSSTFIGSLGVINSLGCVAAAILYDRTCRRIPLRQSLFVSILIHAFGTLFYLGYRSHVSAIGITALEGVAQTLAVLPLYDIAARATPRGSEALGYAVMMSVWNFTIALSDLLGSRLYGHYGLTFRHLVWLNAGTTLLVLAAVPFLPRALTSRRDGEAAESKETTA